MANLFFSKKIIIPAIIFFGGLLIAYGILTSVDFNIIKLPVASRPPQWTQNVGEGISIPACVSSSVGSTTCDSATISWAGDHCMYGENYSEAHIYLDDVWQTFYGGSSLGSHTFTGLSGSRTYSYRIQTYCFGDSQDLSTGSFSTPSCAPPSPSPPPPSGLTASCSSDGTVSVSWNAASGADSYHLYLDYAGDGYYPSPSDESIPNITSTSFSGSAGPGTSYNWAIVYSYSNSTGYSSTYAQSAPFSCPLPNSAPTIDNVTISSSPVYPNGGNPSKYDITITATDANGGTTIRAADGIINYQGVNAGQHRGYFSWFDPSRGLPSWGSADYKAGSLINCTGGGQSVIFGAGYGTEYINLHACSASVSGNTLTATFNVSFNPNFTSPTTNNTLSGYAIDNAGAISNWQQKGTFSLALPPPPGDFNLSQGAVACNSVPLSWTAASGADGYRILKGSPRVDISPYQPYTALNFNDTTVSQNTNYIYQIEAYNSAGTNRSNATTVTTPYCPPYLSFTANVISMSPESSIFTLIDKLKSFILTKAFGGTTLMYIFQGQRVSLNWTTAYVTSCTASSEPTQSDWNGFKLVNGNQVVTPDLPPQIAYTMSCSGLGGETSETIVIQIAPYPDWHEIVPR